MSQDKLELVRAGIRSFTENEDRSTSLFDEDVVWDFSGLRGWIEDSEYHGRAAFDAQMQRWTEPFESWTMEVDEVLDAGGDEVLVLGRQRGALKDGGAVVEMPLAQILTVTDGKLKRLRLFADHDDARAAAGLEQDA